MERPPTPDDPSRSRPYDREHNLKQFWFDLFALDEGNTLLPYEDMLLYMAAVPNPFHGLYRALAIAERRELPAWNEQLSQIVMHCGAFHTPDYDQLMNKEREQSAETSHDGLISIDALHQVMNHAEVRRQIHH